MKKVLLGLSLVSAMFASDIKQDNMFVGVEGGRETGGNNSYGIRAGTYFYSDNKYNINNRVYISSDLVDDEEIDTRIDTKVSLDWIWTNTLFKPFVGVSVGKLYLKNNNSDNQGKKTYSTYTNSFQGGILFYTNDNIEIETGLIRTHPWKKNKKISGTPYKKLYLALNYSF